MPTDQHKLNAAKGGRIGGPKSPTNFKNNPDLARSAGSKSKRGPIKHTCEWCGEVINKRDFTAHAKEQHPKLFQKFGTEQIDKAKQ